MSENRDRSIEQNEPPEKESQTEHIPTREEIIAVLKQVVEGEYKEVLALEDEKGLYLVEVKMPGEAEGEFTEYIYKRQNEHGIFRTSGTAIHVAYYENGIPVSGTNVAEYVDGKWKIIK